MGAVVAVCGSPEKTECGMGDSTYQVRIPRPPTPVPMPIVYKLEPHVRGTHHFVEWHRGKQAEKATFRPCAESNQIVERKAGGLL